MDQLTFRIDGLTEDDLRRDTRARPPGWRAVALIGGLLIVAVAVNPSNRPGVRSGTAPDQKQGGFGSTKRIPFSLVGRIYLLEPGTPRLPNLENLIPIGTIYSPSLNIPPRDFREGFPGVTGRFEWFAIDYRGAIRIEKRGLYRFKLTSDDGSKLFVDNRLLIDNDGIHPATSGEGTLLLGRGTHGIRVQYFQGPATGIALVLEMAREGEQFVPLSTR